MSFLNRATRYGLLRAAARVGIGAASVLPRGMGLALFGTMGALAYCVPHPDRRRTLRHLKLIFGNTWDDATIRRTAHRVYRELGKNMFDAFRLPLLTRGQFDAVVTHDSLDAVTAAYNKGRGGVVITAHTGCFEMLLHFFPRHGFKSFAVGRKLHDEGLDRIIRQTRSGGDIVYMDRSEPARNILRLLREGRLFGALVDQDTAVEGVFADFLGRPAFTPSGPIKIAMRMHLPLFVATTARQRGDRHHVFITGPLDLQQSGNFERDLIHNISTINRLIGATVIRYPEQWVWMHNRWRQQPSAGHLKLMAEAA
ncbi:MAG: lysophospholipid acyltransferase family protein [Chitinispirillaceae bacterium]|nr:lysophospholipid acyltransferase family protein [Chitinispirillaceae bacterium]